jgi:plastocyanin
MAHMNRAISLVCALTAATSLAGCTPGAQAAPTTAVQSSSTLIHLGLTKYGPTNTQYGIVSGYSPNPLIVKQGAVIQFVNDDGFRHTASFLSTTAFPKTGPGVAALTPSGSDLATPGWSTGDLIGGAGSQTFKASTKGTYFYGCFHHYPLNPSMRGVIVVQ